MKKSTLPFLYCMLSLLIAHARQVPMGDKSRIQELQKEKKQVQQEVSALKKLQILQNKKFQAIQKQWRVQYPTFHIDPLKVNSNIAEKITDNSLGSKIQKRKTQNSLNNDSNYLKQQIILLKQELISLQKQIHESEQLLQAERQKLFSEKLNNQLLKGKAARGFNRAEKKLYYLQESWKNKKNDALGKLKIPSFKNQVYQAQIEQLKLLNQMKSGQNVFAQGYQSKSRLQNKLPMNQPGITTERQEALISQIQSQVQNLNACLDSFHEIKNKDSLSFKPNPFKTLTFLQRIQPGFSWQAEKNNGIYPGRIEWMPGLRFSWTPKLQAQIAGIIRTGVGTDIQHITLSFQGYGIQTGIQYSILKKVAFNIYCDQSYYPEPNSESKSRYVLKPGFVLGISSKGKLQMMLAYDFLQYLHPEKGSPWIMRFSL